jgi:hypothetical protein
LERGGVLGFRSSIVLALLNTFKVRNLAGLLPDAHFRGQVEIIIKIFVVIFGNRRAVDYYELFIGKLLLNNRKRVEDLFGVSGTSTGRTSTGVVKILVFLGGKEVIHQLNKRLHDKNDISLLNEEA